jgi:hypothetical protein
VHFLVYHQITKKVPKKGNTQQCRTRCGRIYFFFPGLPRHVGISDGLLSFVSWSCFLCLRLHDLVMITTNSAAEGWLDVFFRWVWTFGLWIMMELGGWTGIGRAGICVRISQIACMHADDDGLFERHQQTHKALPLDAASLSSTLPSSHGKLQSSLPRSTTPFDSDITR